MLIFGGFASDGGSKGGASSAADSRHGKRGSKHGSKHGGGGGATGSYSNAIYALHAERGTWSMPTVHITPGGAPPRARLGATATALHDREIVLFGGSHRGVPCADLDLLTASADIVQSDAVLRVGQPDTVGTPPPARFSHCAALLGHSDVAIFGGGGGADGRRILGDVALLHSAQMRWSVIEFRGIPPAPRVGAIGAVVGAELRLWLFGGCTSVEALPLNDVHTLDASRRAEDDALAQIARADAVADPFAVGEGAVSGPTGGAAAAAPLPPRLRPPPRARLAPAHHQLRPLLEARPLLKLRKPPPPPPPPTSEAPAPGPVVLMAQNVSVDSSTAAVAPPAAPQPPPPPPTPVLAQPPPDLSGSPSGRRGVPIGKCTTILVRRDGGYVLKPIKDETCRGCSICLPTGSVNIE